MCMAFFFRHIHWLHSANFLSILNNYINTVLCKATECESLIGYVNYGIGEVQNCNIQAW